MDCTHLQSEVAEFCRAHADPAERSKYARFFPDEPRAWGVPGADLLSFEHRYLAEHADELAPLDCLELGQKLLVSGQFEEAEIALALARHVLHTLGRAELPLLAAWLDSGINNWASCDELAREVLGVMLARGAVVYSDLLGWRSAASCWRRRALPVSLVALCKRGDAVEPLLNFIQPMLFDSDPLVQQGLGQLLRECWKKEPQTVERLLARSGENAARLLAEAANGKLDNHGKPRLHPPA